MLLLQEKLCFTKEHYYFYKNICVLPREMLRLQDQQNNTFTT